MYIGSRTQMLRFTVDRFFCWAILISTGVCSENAQDTSPHTTRFVVVDRNVKLEVLDWGGSGRPIVLLSGLGGTAHDFDDFAPKLIANYHVYGITRRGFGNSNAPGLTIVNYSADRLGDDVLEACAALALVRPVLIGHSIAGEELSSIGSRHPEKVAALIYLDAVYSYSYFAGAARHSLTRYPLLSSISEIRQDPLFRKGFFATSTAISGTEEPHLRSLKSEFPITTPREAIMAGQQEYTDIHGPILAFFPIPHDLRKRQDWKEAGALAAAEADDARRMEALIKAFKAGTPQAEVIRLPNASHFVYVSNEADVLREVRTFLERFP